ncbi:MAG: hypothetical protein ABIN89_28930 [Chitinophagaceae bacterium]
MIREVLESRPVRAKYNSTGDMMFLEVSRNSTNGYFSQKGPWEENHPTKYWIMYMAGEK